MNKPINFEKIDRTDFEMEGHSFYFDFDNMQNYKDRNWIWIFCNGPILGDYCVLFELKWEHNCYSMKKCVLGAGDAGDWIFQDKHLNKDFLKTKDEFSDYIKQIIEKEIEYGTFKN